MPEISINTTQNVPIKFTVANLGSRFGAHIADGVVKLGYYLIVNWLILSQTQTLKADADVWSMMAINIFALLPIMVYSLLQEWMMEGQTIGKKLFKIKVVKIDGYQATFMDYLTRWVMRLIDISGTLYLAGTISMAVSKSHQRLGDMAAGTAVISLKNKINISHTILENIAEDYQPTYSAVLRFTDNDIRIIKETYIAAKNDMDYETINKLILKIEEVSGIKREKNGYQFIEKIIRDYNYYTGK
jgi:uncharacterized RDD family membrane protein YckC